MNRIGQALLAGVLALAMAGCSTMSGEGTRYSYRDRTITHEVKSQLASEHTTAFSSIDVATVHRTVYLSGLVPDRSTKRRAAEIARGVDGVTEVVNNLQTQSAADAPPPSNRPYMYWGPDQAH